MLVNVSHSDPRLKKEIDNLVGQSFGFFKALKMGGTGSQRLLVTNSSEAIKALFKLDQYPDNCNIEIRPKGIIIHFRSRLEMLNWVIPETKKEIVHQGNLWRIGDGKDFIEVAGTNNRKLDSQFYHRLTS